MLVCPITSTQKDYMFEVPIPAGLAVIGVVLVDQTRSIDWAMRNVVFICRMPHQVVAAVKRTLAKLVQ